MASIGRVEQAVLLLQERLQRLDGKSTSPAQLGASAQAAEAEPIERLRRLLRRGQLSRAEVRKALVRHLLGAAMGPTVAGSLEFQALSDEVYTVIAGHDAGRNLLDRALAEAGLG